MKNFLVRMWASFIEARQRQANRRIAMMQLYSLTDKELHDIGISRCDIKRVCSI
jgi:uncharacterized protein YjiS (DUF1127 family)